MASIQTRNSVAAIVKEVAEGELKAPTSATQYIAVQDDFSMSANFENLDNSELKASIGAAKPIVGSEAPQSSFSHYLRHSAVEGQAPSYGPLLEACLGAVVTASTEYDTVAASTVSVIKVGSGEGAQLQRGQALLIKDSVNGYRIRGIDSVSGDNLNLGFQLPTGLAPAAGVNLGKCVLYKPANSGHPTLSIWDYKGQGGAIQAMSGARVTNASFDISAGQLINANYSLEGVEYFFDPIEVVTGANDIVFDIGGGPVTASVALGWYKTPHDLAAAVKTAISGAAAGTYTCTYDDATGMFTVTKSAGTLSIDWATGANSIGATLGFTSDDSGGLSYTSDVAQDYSSPHTPSFDAADPLAAKDNEVMVGLGTEFACFKASSVNLTIDTPKADIQSVCAVSGKDGSIIQSREVTVAVTALLEQYDAKQFERFRNGTEVKFQYSFGQKSGGNWIAGKCGMLYVPTAVIQSFNVTDTDGLATVELELKAFVNSSGEGEVYVAFV